MSTVSWIYKLKRKIIIIVQLNLKIIVPMLDNSKIKRREKNYYSNINVKKKKTLKRDYTLINFKEYRFNVRYLWTFISKQKERLWSKCEYQGEYKRKINSPNQITVRLNLRNIILILENNSKIEDRKEKKKLSFKRKRYGER